MDLLEIKQNMNKKILQFSIPSIIAMIMTSLITVADGFFVGNYVGKDGIAAINFGLPIIYLFLALGLMVSVGGIAIAGIAYGSKETDRCKSIFNQTIITVIIMTIITAIIVAFGLKPMSKFLGLTNNVETYFLQYFGIILFELPIMVLNSSLAMFVRGEGYPELYMKINIANVVLNIVLDYVFTAFFGLGVRGIAVASLISALFALILILIFFAKTAKVYRFISPKKWKFDKEVLKNTLLNGSSEFIGEMSSCIAMFSFNYVIMKYIGLDGIAAFSIVGYVSYVFSMVLIGFGQGIVPLVGFAYGSKDKKTAQDLRTRTNTMVFICGLVVFVLMTLLTKPYSSLFIKNENITKMICNGMWIFMLSFLASGLNTITSFYFTSIAKAFESAIISSARGLVILLICIFTLPRFWGMTGVWLVSPITEAVTLLLSFMFIIKDKKTQN